MSAPTPLVDGVEVEHGSSRIRPGKTAGEKLRQLLLKLAGCEVQPPSGLVSRDVARLDRISEAWAHLDPDTRFVWFR